MTNEACRDSGIVFKTMRNPDIKLTITNDETQEQFYELSIKDGYLWLCNQDGEGMGMNSDKAYKALDSFFKENH